MTRLSFFDKNKKVIPFLMLSFLILPQVVSAKTIFTETTKPTTSTAPTSTSLPETTTKVPSTTTTTIPTSTAPSTTTTTPIRPSTAPTTPTIPSTTPANTPSTVSTSPSTSTKPPVVSNPTPSVPPSKVTPPAPSIPTPSPTPLTPCGQSNSAGIVVACPSTSVPTTVNPNPPTAPSTEPCGCGDNPSYNTQDLNEDGNIYIDFELDTIAPTSEQADKKHEQALNNYIQTFGQLGVEKEDINTDVGYTDVNEWDNGGVWIYGNAESDNTGVNFGCGCGSPTTSDDYQDYTNTLKAKNYIANTHVVVLMSDVSKTKDLLAQIINKKDINTIYITYALPSEDQEEESYYEDFPYDHIVIDDMYLDYLKSQKQIEKALTRFQKKLLNKDDVSVSF